MKKILCLAICCVMIFGIVCSTVSAMPYTEKPADSGVKGGGIELPEITLPQNSVVTGVDAETITIIKGYNCYYDGYYDEHDNYVEYNCYDYRYIPATIILHLSGSSTVELGYLADGFYYENDYHSIETSDDQKTNEWGVGVHTVNCSVLGYNFTVEVEIIETPVVSVSIDPLTVINGCNIISDSYYDESLGEYMRYNYYRYTNCETNITVVFNDGSKATVNSLNSGVYYKGDYYQFSVEDDQKTNNWGVSAYTATGAIMNYEFPVTVNIVDCPVTEVTVKPLSIVKDTHCHEDYYYDDNISDYIYYTHYDVAQVETEITFYFTDADPVTVNNLNAPVFYKGIYYDMKYNDAQSLAPWDVGVYYPAFQCAGFNFNAEVSIIGSHVTNVETERLQIIKDTDTQQTGYYDYDLYQYVSYNRYKYEDNSAVITLTLDNGETVNLTSLDDSFYYDGDGYYYIDIEDDGQKDTPWGLGVHTLNCSIMNYDFTFEVEIVETPVERVEFTPVKLVKDMGGYYSSYYDYDLDEWVEYYHYNYTNTATAITIYLKNGETIEMTRLNDYFEYGGNTYRITFSDNQQKSPWGAGSHKIQCSVLGFDFEADVNIIDTPVVNVVATPIKILQGYNGYTTSRYDDTLGEWVDFYYYNFYYLDTEVTVYFDDGTSAVTHCLNDSIGFGGTQYDITYTDNQHDTPWGVGAHYVNCSVLGFDFTVEADIVDSFVSSVDVDRISIIKGTNTEECDYYDETIGDYVTYTRYNPMNVTTNIVITMEDGEEIRLDYLNNYLYYNNNYYDIYMSDDGGQANGPWDVGVHTVTCVVMNREFTVEVEILPSPIKSVDASKIKIIQGYNGEQREYYDDAAGTYVQFYLYFFQNVNAGLVIDFGDHTETLNNLNDRVTYNGEEYRVDFRDRQYDNPWGLGEHEVQCSVLGYDFTVIVEITDSPITNIVAAPIVIIEGCRCYTDWYYDDVNDVDVEFNHYDIMDDSTIIAVEVYFEDGSKQTLSRIWDGVEYCGTIYGPEWEDDQYEKPWTVGGDNVLRGTLLGHAYDIPVQLIKTPVVKHTSDKITIVKGCNGENIEYYDYINDIDVNFFHYYIDYLPIHVTFETADGQIYEINGMNEDRTYGSAEYWLNYDDPQFDEPWTVGPHSIPCSMFGYNFDIEVDIVECPVVSVEAERITVIKNSAGYFTNRYDDTLGDYVEFFWYDIENMPFNITVELDDGTTVTLEDLYDSVEYKGLSYRMDYVDDQYDKPWTVGVNLLKCSLFGADFNVEIEVIESPVTSVVTDEITIIKDNFGSTVSYYDYANGSYVSFYRYDFDDCAVKFTATTADGQTVTCGGIYEEGTYKGVRYRINYTDPQYDEAWGVGAHKIPCSWMGYDFELTVNIIENPIESVTAEPVTFYDGAFNGTYSGYVNGEYVSYRYYYYAYKCNFTVNFKDGSSTQFTGNKFTYEGIRYNVSFNDDQSRDNVWTVGDHVADCVLLGMHIPVTVSIISSPVKSVTVDRYVIIEGTHCHQDYYNDEHGNEVWFTVYDDVYRNAVMTVEFIDGTVVKEYLGNSVKYGDDWFNPIIHETQVPPDVWGVGVHEVHCTLVGFDFDVEVEIIETPVDHVDAPDIVIVENTFLDETWYYNDTVDRWVQGYYYNYTDLVNLKIYFKDGTTAEMVNGGSVRYGDLEIYYERSDDQNGENVWGLGRHRAGGRVGGYEFEFDVIIKENPVASFDVKDAVVKAIDAWDYLEAVKYLQKHITFEVTTKKGEVLTGNLYDGVIIDGAVVKPDTDNIFDRMNPGEFEYECALGDLVDRFSLVIEPNPFEHASPDMRLRVPDSMEKTQMTAWVGDREVEYEGYDWVPLIGDIKVFLTNTVVYDIMHSDRYIENDEYTREEYDRVKDSVNGAGKRFVESIVECAFDVHSDQAIDLVGLTPEQLLDDYDMLIIFAGIVWGYLENNGDGNYLGLLTGRTYQVGQFTEEAFWKEIKLEYTDEHGVIDYDRLSEQARGYNSLYDCIAWEAGIERCIIAHDGSFEFEGKRYTIGFTDDQMFWPWEIGNNFIEIDIYDEDGTIVKRSGSDVELYEAINIESISIEPVTLYEYQSWMFENEEGSFREYDIRIEDLEATITVDGHATQIEFRGWWTDNRTGTAEIEFEYNGNSYFLVLNGWQSVGTPWSVGVNTIECEVCGVRSSFDVTIIGKKKVTAENITLMQGAQMDENGIYHYFPLITVTYTDNTTISSDNDEFFGRYFVEISDTQDKTKWGIGKHTAYLTLNGENRTSFKVEIIENTVASISIEDLQLFEDKDGFRHAIYNSKTGKYTRGDEFNGAVRVTVTLKDGTVLNGWGGVEYNGSFNNVEIDASNSGMLTPFSFGSGTFTLKGYLMGAETTFTVKVVESYYDTHAVVTADNDDLFNMFNVVDDDKYEQGAIISLIGYIEDEVFTAISRSIGNGDFMVIRIVSGKADGSAARPNGTVRVEFDLNGVPEEMDLDSIVCYSARSNGSLSTVNYTIDKTNMKLIFELNGDEYYILTVASEPDVIAGDFNDDGKVDNKDVVALFRYLSGEGGGSGTSLAAGDFNGDGKVNNKDVTLLYRYVSGKS